MLKSELMGGVKLTSDGQVYTSLRPYQEDAVRKQMRLRNPTVKQQYSYGRDIKFWLELREIDGVETIVMTKEDGTKNYITEFDSLLGEDDSLLGEELLIAYELYSDQPHWRRTELKIQLPRGVDKYKVSNFIRYKHPMVARGYATSKIEADIWTLLTSVKNEFSIPKLTCTIIKSGRGVKTTEESIVV